MIINNPNSIKSYRGLNCEVVTFKGTFKINLVKQVFYSQI